MAKQEWANIEIFDRIKAHISAFNIVGTIIEAVVIAGGLLRFLPLHVVTALAVSIPLLSVIVYQYKVLRISKTYSRIARHCKQKIIIEQTEKNGLLKAKRYFDITSEAISPIRNYSWSINRRGDDEPAYETEGARPTINRISRSKTGECIVHPYHKTKNSLAFRADFNPSLRINESFTLDGYVTICNYVAKDTDALNRRSPMSVPTSGNLELVSASMAVPTIDFVFEVLIPKSLKTSNHSFDVTGSTFSLAKKRPILQRESSFR